MGLLFEGLRAAILHLRRAPRQIDISPGDWKSRRLGSDRLASSKISFAVDSIIGKSLKSLWFDLDMARMHELPITVRARFLTQKVAALAALARGSTFNLTVGEAIVTVTSFTDLGTLQSCISDVRDELIPPTSWGASRRS